MKLGYKRLLFFSLVAAYTTYSVFVYTHGTETDFEMNAESRHGKLIFQQKNCIACHQIYGLGGYMGPDLTNVISKKGVDYTKIFIQNGTNRMPDFNLNNEEVNALIAYLSFVDSSSVYPDPSVRLTWFGSMDK
jgi:nitric oxide reductase subunit C